MDTYCICCFILLTSFVGVLSEKKYVRRGESVILFENVTADSPDNEVHLYINGVKDNTRIASWKFGNGRFTPVYAISQNIEMDGNRTIWIYNVDVNYTGKYSLYKSLRPSIELILLEKKDIRRGESVTLFENVTADSPDNEVHLYSNGVKGNQSIASWKFEKGQFTLVYTISQNIEMDGNRTIWIHNVDVNYTGKYSLYNLSGPSIELNVLGSSQNKSENTSYNIVPLIVGIALAIFAFAFISLLALTTKWRRKFRAFLKRRHREFQMQQGTEERVRLVSFKNLQNEDIGMNSQSSNGSMDKVEDEHKKPTVVGSNTKIHIIQVETAAVRKKNLTANDQKPQNEDIGTNSQSSNGSMDKIKDALKKPTVVGSNTKLEQIQETAERKEKATASNRKPQHKEKDMKSDTTTAGMVEVEDSNKKPSIVASSLKNGIPPEDTEERKEQFTVRNPKPQNEDTDMNSHIAKAGMDKVEDANKKPTVVQKKTQLSILPKETAERKEKLTVSYEKTRSEDEGMKEKRLDLDYLAAALKEIYANNRKPQNNDIDMKSDTANKRLDKVEDSNKMPTVVESSSKHGILPKETEEKKEVSYEKSRSEEEGMKHSRFNKEDLVPMLKEIKEERKHCLRRMDELQQNLDAMMTKLKSEKEERKHCLRRMDELQQNLDVMMTKLKSEKASQEECMPYMNEQMELEEKKRTKQVHKATIQRLTNEIRKKEEENRQLKEEEKWRKQIQVATETIHRLQNELRKKVEENRQLKASQEDNMPCMNDWRELDDEERKNQNQKTTETIHRSKNELRKKEEENRKLKASQEESISYMNERMELEENKSKNQDKKATETIHRLENEIRKKEEENRKLKDKMEKMTNNRGTNDLEGSEHQSNTFNTEPGISMPEATGSPTVMPISEDRSDIKHLNKRVPTESLTDSDNEFENYSTPPEQDQNHEESD